MAVALSLSGCSRTAQSPPAATQPAPSQSAAAANAPTVETETVAAAPFAAGIAATGKVLVPENRIAVIGPVHEGRLVRLYAGQGSRVKKGDKLADLESSDVDDAKSDYLRAAADYDNAQRTSQAEIRLAQQTFDRTKMLYEKTITAQKNFEAADHDLQVAKSNAESSIASTKAALEAARRKLVILGLSDAEIDALKQTSSLGAVFSLNSPIDGVVVERTATIGATVGPDANVFKIVDTSSVWVDADVFEKDVARARVGQPVNLSVPAFPNETFKGRVIFISSVLDPDTRTMKVRTDVANPAGKLKPDMFANVRIITDQASEAIALPSTAILNDNGQNVVFVAAASGYERRAVTLGIQSDNRVEIRDGLKPGDKVVVKGNYLLLEQSRRRE